LRTAGSEQNHSRRLGLISWLKRGVVASARDHSTLITQISFAPLSLGTRLTFKKFLQLLHDENFIYQGAFEGKLTALVVRNTKPEADLIDGERRLCRQLRFARFTPSLLNGSKRPTISSN
jgi:hypothetical protein